MKLLIAVLSVFSVAYGQQDGTVALFRSGVTSSSYTSGLVQVYYNETWEGVCNTSPFSMTEASVICHQLGYTQATDFGNTNMYGTVEEATYTDVRCSNSEYQVLFQCDYDRTGCDADMAVWVECSSTRVWDDPFDGQVRLTDGEFSNQGRVEIYCNNEFGSVCYSGFGTEPGDTVCEQLGYNNRVATTATSRNDSDPIWLTNVASCGLFDNCLSSCQSCPSQDAASSCTSGNVIYIECSYEDESSSGTNTRTLDSCDFTEITEAITRLIGIIVGVVVACCVVSIILALLPFCICCCLGVGIGAAASRA